jgi:hypothetical protein
METGGDGENGEVSKENLNLTMPPEDKSQLEISNESNYGNYE